MSHSTPARLIRCGKCQAQMGIRHYVLFHRRGNGVPCPPVTCVVCETPITGPSVTVFRELACSEACAKAHPGRIALREAREDLLEELRAIDRARFLPPIYHRCRRAS